LALAEAVRSSSTKTRRRARPQAAGRAWYLAHAV